MNFLNVEGLGSKVITPHVALVIAITVIPDAHACHWTGHNYSYPVAVKQWHCAAALAVVDAQKRDAAFFCQFEILGTRTGV